MKFSYRSHPGIQIIESQTFKTQIWNGADQAYYQQLLGYFKNVAPHAKPVKIISRSLAQVILETYDKMIDDEIWKDIGLQAGAVCIEDFTYCYIIDSKGRMEHDLCVYVFYKDEFFAFSWQNIEKDMRMTVVPQNSKWFLANVKPDGQARWEETIFDALYTTLISILNFFKYADTQDKYINAGAKEKGIDCKYINETNSDIQYITSHYVTNLYVQGAFKVRGHWRLQPKKKDGEWTKELIWINEFQKEGYTRKAGILNQQK